MRRILLALIVAAVPLTALAADPVRGAQLFHDDGCFECHGMSGQGGVAPSLAPPAAPTADRIAAYIRDPRGEMPPYNAKVLDDAAIADIRAYLETLPMAPDPATLRQFDWPKAAAPR